MKIRVLVSWCPACMVLHYVTWVSSYIYNSSGFAILPSDDIHLKSCRFKEFPHRQITLLVDLLNWLVKKYKNTILLQMCCVTHLVNLKYSLSLTLYNHQYSTDANASYVKIYLTRNLILIRNIWVITYLKFLLTWTCRPTMQD